MKLTIKNFVIIHDSKVNLYYFPNNILQQTSNMLTKRGFLTVWLLITLIAYWYGDNPVMCTLHQVKGQWLFTFGTQTIKKETKDYDKFSWGRHQPTKLVEFNSDPGEQQRFLNELQGVSADKAKESIRQVVFELTDYDNHVYQHQYDGENISAAQENVGNWTMLLHEGLLGFVFDQKLDQMIVFNSFWRYNLLDKSEKKYESIWYETMVGWYHTINQDDPNSEDWGCFYAKKIDPTKEDLDQSKHFIFNGGRPVFTDKSNNNNKWINDLKSKALSGLLTWHTDSSRDIAKSANFAAFSPTLIEDSHGVPSSSKISRDNEGKLSGLGDYYYLVGKNPQDISDLELPHSLNWNNINGYSFFPEIVKQGCGNWYLIASIYSMESRIMIASNGKLKPKISIQQQMDWNWYAEGCVGGLPINVAKYGWEFEFVSEKNDTQVSLAQNEIGIQ